MSAEVMKALFWLGGDRLEVRAIPIPAINDDEVLIDVAYTGICASDMHILAGALAGAIDPPWIPGHEFSGVIAKVGSAVADLQVGARVVAHPNHPCGRCPFCREGRENLCSQIRSVIRGPYTGTFAEYVRVNRRQVYLLPEQVALREAALVEPAAIGLHAVDRAQLKPGESLLIAGGGAIGLLTLEMAKLGGAFPIVLSEPSSARRRLALSLGADHVVDPVSENLAERVAQLTGVLGPEICIDASGHPQVIERLIDLTRAGGRTVIVSWPQKEQSITISPMNIYRREIDIRGSFFSPFSFQRTVGLLPRLNLAPLATHVFALDEWKQALTVQKEMLGIKVLFRP